MGSALSLTNDTEDTCRVRIYTVGRSFVVGDKLVPPGKTAVLKVHKVGRPRSPT
jgi:hypothetical protein